MLSKIVGVLLSGLSLPPLPEPLLSMMQTESTPLQNMLSSRAFMTALQRRISYEVLDTNHILGAVALFQQNHHFDPLFFGCCLLISFFRIKLLINF